MFCLPLLFQAKLLQHHVSGRALVVRAGQAAAGCHLQWQQKNLDHKAVSMNTSFLRWHLFSIYIIFAVCRHSIVKIFFSFPWKNWSFMSKTICEDGYCTTIPFKSSKTKHNLKFYDSQIFSVCYLLFIFIVDSSLVLVCFSTSKSLFFMNADVQWKKQHDQWPHYNECNPLKTACLHTIYKLKISHPVYAKKPHFSEMKFILK